MKLCKANQDEIEEAAKCKRLSAKDTYTKWKVPCYEMKIKGIKEGAENERKAVYEYFVKWDADTEIGAIAWMHDLGLTEEGTT